MFQTKIVEKIKTHRLHSITFFLKSCRLWDNVENSFRAGQATDDNMAHTHCILDNQGYKFTLRTWNIYWFSTATMVAWTHLNVALYVHCLSVTLFCPYFQLAPKCFV